MVQYLAFDRRGLHRLIADQLDPQLLLIGLADVLEGADELARAKEELGSTVTS